MSVERTALQKDMFSGEYVDKRTASQKRADKERNDWKQTEMFSQRDLAQFGVSAHPVMDVSPGKLVLISEDPRTPEEKERDLRLEAEAKTRPMFPDTSSDNIEVATPEQSTSEHLQQDNPPASTPESIYESVTLTSEPQVQVLIDIEPEKVQVDETPKAEASVALGKLHDAEPMALQFTPENPKTTAYIELVQAMHEQVSTIWIADEYKQHFWNQLPLAIIRATAAGLTSSEISEALHVGKFLYMRDTSQDEGTPNAAPSPDIPEAKPPVSIPVYIAEEPKEKSYGVEKGYRKQVRGQDINLRKRGFT
jgi:hypothetical protein